LPISAPSAPTGCNHEAPRRDDRVGASQALKKCGTKHSIVVWGVEDDEVKELSSCAERFQGTQCICAHDGRPFIKAELRDVRPNDGCGTRRALHKRGVRSTAAERLDASSATAGAEVDDTRAEETWLEDGEE
jgi:hypothetical protein